MDSFMGSLIGSVVGDAYGTTVEFKPKGSFTMHDDIIGGGHYEMKVGGWTDDTSLMLCTLVSIVAKKSIDFQDIMSNFCLWLNDKRFGTGCYDTGSTIKNAVKSYDGANPFCGISNVATASNGALMRITPIPLFFYQNIKQAVKVSGDAATLTHGMPNSVNACKLFAELCINAMFNKDKKLVFDINENTDNPLTFLVTDTKNKNYNFDLITGKGDAIHTIASVLWAFNEATSFEDGMKLVVSLGEDADTTGCIYGQLAGAYYGYAAIPERWLQKVCLVSDDGYDIMALGKELFSIIGA
jgi:ADP-ribosyl-[dinitrogen reductase] hydrolase